MPNNAYAETDFFRVWNAYIQQLTDNGERIQVALLNKELSIINNVIQLKTSNEISKKEILNSKERILSFIHKELLNYSIDLEVIVVEEPKTKEIFAFSEKDKYDVLLSENGLLEELRLALELDFK